MSFLSWAGLFLFVIIPISLLIAFLVIATTFSICERENYFNPKKMIGMMKGQYVTGRGWKKDMEPEKDFNDILEDIARLIREQEERREEREKLLHFQSYLFTNPYSTLGVLPFSSRDVCEDAYRRLAKRYHPDNIVTGNGEKMKQLNEAISMIRREKVV